MRILLDESTIRRRYDSGASYLFVTLGELARRGGRLPEALELLESGLKRYPEMVSGWIVLARVQGQLGRFQQAQEIYRHVHQDLDPRNIPALRALVTSSVAAGEHGEARDLLVMLLREDPCDFEAEDLQEEIRTTAEKMAWRTEGETAAVAVAAPAASPQVASGTDPDELGRELISAPSLSDLEAWGEEGELREEPAGGVKR